MANLNEKAQKKIAERYVEIADGLFNKVEKGIELTDTEACLFVLGFQYKYALESLNLIFDEILPSMMNAMDANKEILDILKHTDLNILKNIKGSEFIS